MKKLFLLLFLSLFIFPIGLKANSAHTETSRTNITSDYYVTVVKIVDGDSFIGLTNDRKEVHYRL